MENIENLINGLLLLPSSMAYVFLFYKMILLLKEDKKEEREAYKQIVREILENESKRD